MTKWPKFGFGALLRPLNELRTQEMDSIQLGVDGGTIWGLMILQGEQQYARLVTNL